jgi:hypothetical protein
VRKRSRRRRPRLASIAIRGRVCSWCGAQRAS